MRIHFKKKGRTTEGDAIFKRTLKSLDQTASALED